MKLYYSPGACRQAPHIILHETGLSHDAMRSTSRRSAPRTGATIADQPEGSVPALELDNGEVLTENAVVLQYLGDRTSSASGCRRSAIFAATACSNGSITSPPSCTRLRALFKADAGDEVKAFATKTVEERSTMSSGSSPGPTSSARGDAARRLSVRHPRLGGQDHRARQMAQARRIPAHAERRAGRDG